MYVKTTYSIGCGLSCIVHMIRFCNSLTNANPPYIAATTSQQQLSYDIYQPIWYYRDNTSYAIQGPFSGYQMLGWRYFFPPTTPVRFGDGSHFHFVPLYSVDFTNPRVPPPLIHVNNVGEDNATKKENDRASMVNDNNEPNSDGWDVFRFQIREEKRTNKVFNSAEEFLYHWLVEINRCDESSSPKPIFMNNQKKSHKKTQDNFHQEAAARYKQLTYTQKALYRAIAKEYFKKKRSDNAGSNATVKSEEVETDNKEDRSEKLKQNDEGRKKSNVSWDERFSQLKQYKEQNGHCRVPLKYKANPQLGNWVGKQRQKYKKNKLLPKEIKSLEGIGFVWEPQKHLGWDERFKQLKEYKEKNGHCRVPKKYKANPQLGNWVSTQRYLYKKKNQDRETITEEQINRLEGIGFVWEPPLGRRL